MTTTVEIKSNIDTKYPKHVAALATFLNVIGGMGQLGEAARNASESTDNLSGAITAKIGVQFSKDGDTEWHPTFEKGDIFMQQLLNDEVYSEPIQIGEPKKKRAPRKVKETETETETNEGAKPEVNEGAKPEVNEGAKPEVNTDQKEEVELSIEKVRALMGTKIEDHRPTIKAKLSELEAKNISTMCPTKYEDFVKFLNSLD